MTIKNDIWAIPAWGLDAEQNADIEQKVVQDRAISRFVKSEEWHGKIAKALTDLCGLPAPGQEFLIVTEKSFNAYACIKALLEEGEIIDEMHLAIYRINQPTVSALIQLMDSGKIRKASFVISSFFSQTKKPEVWAEMLRDYCVLHPKTTRHSYLHNHAKVLTCRRGGGLLLLRRFRQHER